MAHMACWVGTRRCVQHRQRLHTSPRHFTEPGVLCYHGAFREGQDLMSDDLNAEFGSYRRTLPTEEDKQAFDRKIKRLLDERGVDYVRGYVDALKEAILR